MQQLTPWQQDKKRGQYPPPYLFWYRAYHSYNNNLIRKLCLCMLRICNFLYKVDFPYKATIGPGLVIVHPYGIVINPKAIIGENCNIHKGVTIGQENRGKRKGAPIIGNNVWIGVNATVVGRITIGDDVLIAPGAYVNQNIPPHSVVFGNPCVIKYMENATESYIEID